MWLGAAIAGLFLVLPAALHAQAPVITNPANLRDLDVNIKISPLEADPEWLERAPMPTARAGFATTAAGRKIYAIAGAIVDKCNPIDTVEAYDVDSDLWATDLAPLPEPLRYRPSAGALDGLVYVVAGLADGCPGQALDTVQAYDPATDLWTDRQPLNVARIQVGLGVDTANDLLYAVGGANTDFTALDTVEVYDPSTDSWTVKQHLNTPRGFPAVAAVNGKIYAVGGQKENFRAIDTVEEFDPDANGGFGAWTTKSAIMPHPRLNSATAVVDGKIYVIGGEENSGNSIISTVDVYDPSLDVWTTETAMPTARRYLGAAVVNDTIYAIGGESLAARVGQPFIYQITATNNPTEYDAFPLPDGLHIDPARGIIFGTPTHQADGFIVTFTATNSSGSDSKEVSLYIARRRLPSPELGGILAGTAVTGRAGQPFAFQVLRINAGLEATIKATGLPYEPGVGGGPQLALDPGTGFITGTVPSTLDGSAKSFGLQLGLANADSAQSYLQLTFVSDPFVPVITSGSTAALVLNKFFSYTITADAHATAFDYLGLDGVLDGALPPGLSFNASTGTISGIYTGETSASCRWEQPESRTNRDSPRKGIDTIETIKKEPPPRIQFFATEEPEGTGTAPLDFIIGLHDFEAEVLSSKSSDKTDYVIFTDDPLASGIGAGLLKATRIGDYVSYTVPVAKSGTYDVKVGIRTGESEGIFQLAIDEINQGAPQDGYSPSVAYEVRDLGPVTFDSGGDKSFQFSITSQNPHSSGREFVCDYIDLVPHFEAEKLFVKKHTAPYKTFHDPELSGGAGTLFKARKLGDYLTYAVPLGSSGNYDVRVKTKPTGSAASFQLLIDGQKQGYPQKGEVYYSAGADGVRDLGVAKFENAGEKAFKFLVTERDPKGPGYDFLFDDIQLVLASDFEAEALPVKADGSLVRVQDENLSGEAGILFNPQAAVGEAITYTITVPVAATYEVKIGIRTGKRSGIVQLSIDNVDQGTASDAYSADVDYAVLDLGRVTFTEAGDKAFRFVVTGRNGKSQGLEFLLDYVDLVR